MFMPYDTIFAKFPGQLVVGAVSSIEETKGGEGGKVILKSGEQVAYHVLAVATGSAWEGMVSFPDEESLCKEHVESWRNKFQNAQDIVIVGGGAVGIGWFSLSQILYLFANGEYTLPEVASEIKDVYPVSATFTTHSNTLTSPIVPQNKAVTIVQGNKYLLTDIYPCSFRVALERKLRLREVNIIFDDVIEGHPPVDPDTPIKTRKGTPIKCDLLVAPCPSEMQISWSDKLSQNRLQLVVLVQIPHCSSSSNQKF